MAAKRKPISRTSPARIETSGTKSPRSRSSKKSAPVRHFQRLAPEILPTDIGPPLSELRPNIDVPDPENILQKVIETLSTRERKVRDREGRKYLLRVRPYRTTDNKIDGAALTLIDMDGNSDRRSSNNRRRGARGKQEVTTG